MAKDAVKAPAVPAKQAAPETPVRTEPTYGAAEIAKNAKSLFGYSIDIATAALSYNHVAECTLSEAQQIIKRFAERKVD